MNINTNKPKGNHRYWHTTHKLFLQRLKEINATRPVDKPMTFIEFMHEVANGRIKMPMKGTS
jgi:hypothetical protein